MDPQTDLKQERRKQILDAAEKVFTQRGFNKARMDDIVAESGLSKGALYWYYKSKDEIILALMDRFFAGEMQAGEELSSIEGDARQQLEIFFDTAFKDIRRFEERMSLGYEFFSLAARTEEVRDAIRGYYRRYQAIISQIIQQGIDSGEFSSIDPDDTATVVISIVEGMALLWFLDPELLDWDRIGDLPTRIFLQGIMEKEL
ncbi:MAG: TetR family transcriptional regulator [Anaerolineales bacterium]|nr:TetR family transcriptional regulator [Anaerolineales bacterium]